MVQAVLRVGRRAARTQRRNAAVSVDTLPRNITMGVLKGKFFVQ